ncbi:hypothetical protein EON82_15890 [bacterium]|nr:MAG: hypothetical protein EON82_15890 [bacterium]
MNKGKGGTVTVRERVTPTNPRTAAQLAVRGAQTKSSQLWKNMTPSQIAAWTFYASNLPQVAKRSGLRKKVNPINAFCALGDKFLLVTPGGVVPMVPPTSAFTGDNLTITATAGTGQVTFTASAANTTGTTTELLLQPLKGKNRTPLAKGYRTKTFKVFLAGSLTMNVSVPTGYYAAAYRYVNVATGQATPLVPLSVLTVALSLEDGGTDEAPVAKKKAA